MQLVRLLAAASFLLLPLSLLAGALDDKTPAYFVDRYGPAKSARIESSHSFVHVGRGSVTIKGQFSVREFRQGDLRIQPVFFLPSLKLAAVRLKLNRTWTAEQVEAALEAYGGDWKPFKNRGVRNSWVSPDGCVAINLLTSVDIQSKLIVDMVAKTLAESDAKRKAIPTF